MREKAKGRRRVGTWLLGGLLAVGLGALAGTPGATAGSKPKPEARKFEASVAVEWMDLFQKVVQGSRLSPPVASRAYAYAGVALYESIVDGIPGQVSLAGQLNEMPAMPRTERGRRYDWPTSASAALATLARGIFLAPSAATLQAIDDLSAQQRRERIDAEVPAAVLQRSEAYGRSVGEAILGWSDRDGFLMTRGLPFTPPVGPGLWVPTGPVVSPLEPYWGTLRSFALDGGDACQPAPPVPYSEIAGSPFYAQARTVYDAVNGLDAGQREIALFWADNPGETSTPPGHWLSIAGQIAGTRRLRLDQAASMYALLGTAMGDAFISCWDEKYRSNLLRPVTYIARVIDPSWQTFIPTPPFPEYTSGHSVVSGASATVLTALFGRLTFTDRTHEGRGLTGRSFRSFNEAAREAAVSRLYGGIHYPMAIDKGITQGRCVGRRVLHRVDLRHGRHPH